MKNRFALVAMDKATGDFYVSPDTLLEKYTKEDIEHILKHTTPAMKVLREFYVMPYDQALSLWVKERNEHQGKTPKTIH